MISFSTFHLIDGAALAFIAGLLSSPHCVGMCGPLGCSVFFNTAQAPHDAQLDLASYHIVRGLAYSLIGSLIGFLGSLPLVWLSSDPAKLIAWLAALFFLGTFLQMAHITPKRWKLYYFKYAQKARSFPRGTSGILLGGLTPFIPCGPLYLVFIACAASGSAIQGAEIGLGFALGTIPLLWFAQSQFLRFSPRFKTPYTRWIPSALTLCATLLVLWRITVSSGAIEGLFCHS